MEVNTDVVALPDVDCNKIKHHYVYLSLHPRWIDKHMMIDVNTLLEISVNGGPWHGKAIYICGHDGGQWSLTFNFKADVSKLKRFELKQIWHTSSFLQTSAVLLPTIVAPSANPSLDLSAICQAGARYARKSFSRSMPGK